MGPFVDLAARIRELRDIAGMDQDMAARRLGIPAEAYAGYEKDGADIPISVLYGLAGIFGIDLTELLTGISPHLQHYCLVKSGQGVEIERFPGYRFQSLAFNFVNRRVEPLLVMVEPEENKKMTLVTHPGQEFNYVLDGRIRVFLGGTQIDMSPGDSLYFDPAIPHGQMALDGPARFLTVILHS
jgi:transcriptional regulator with XRE-family HTH domain